MKVLVIDVGGSHVKIGGTGGPQLQFDTEPKLTAKRLVQQVKLMVGARKFNRVTIGIPGRVSEGRVIADPGNIGPGWVGYDFEKAFGKPTYVINDAALQAFGAYEGGKMLFLGLGTGVGSVIVSDQTLICLELGDLVMHRAKLSDRVGRDAFERVGKTRWRKAVIDAAKRLRCALAADYVVIGGGKAGDGMLGKLPDGLRAGGNEDALTGGVRLWNERIVPRVIKSHPWRIIG